MMKKKKKKNCEKSLCLFERFKGGPYKHTKTFFRKMFSGGVINPKTYINHELGSKKFS